MATNIGPRDVSTDLPLGQIKKITCFSFTSGDKSDEGGRFFCFLFFFAGAAEIPLQTNIHCNTIRRLDPDDKYNIHMHISLYSRIGLTNLHVPLSRRRSN